MSERYSETVADDIDLMLRAAAKQLQLARESW